MKRLMILLLCAFVFTSHAVAEPWRVYDNADLFAEEEIKTIEQAISNFQIETNTDFVVLTFDGYFGKNNSGDIAAAFYDSNDFGFGQQANGLLYFFNVNDGMLYANYGLHGEICTIWTIEERNSISDACRNLVMDGKYKNAVLKLIESATEAITAHKELVANPSTIL